MHLGCCWQHCLKLPMYFWWCVCETNEVPSSKHSVSKALAIYLTKPVKSRYMQLAKQILLLLWVSAQSLYSATFQTLQAPRTELPSSIQTLGSYLTHALFMCFVYVLCSCVLFMCFVSCALFMCHIHVLCSCALFMCLCSSSIYDNTWCTDLLTDCCTTSVSSVHYLSL